MRPSFFLGALALLVPSLALAGPAQVARGTRAIISTQGVAATDAARQMLERGGSVIDAAVAASFAISVERPHSTGIGGGGFLLFREARTGRSFAVDFRERAPRAAREKMFIDSAPGPSRGEVIPKLSLDGALASGVPGLVAGLLEIHRKWGRLPLATVMAPAIRLARQGLVVYPALAQALEDRKSVLSKYPATRAIFLKPDGSPYITGERLIQKDLAQTLERIAREGSRAFYRGRISQAIVAESRRLGGILSERDLREYPVKWRAPVRGSFKGFEILSMPPPSSGGTHVIEVLNILEKDDLKSKGVLSTQSIHLVASALQLAFADRAKYMGDPDFVPVPTSRLLSKDHAARLRAFIDPKKARPSAQIPSQHESNETTHFSILDAEGNAVSSTQTINGWMGSGVVVPGTGILLNNEMDDFSAKPGAANLFGAVGGSANAIAPGKTPLSSMSPTIVLKDGRPMLVVGAPGGTRIISCVVQSILNYLEFGLPLGEAITIPRFHHQWLPDQLSIDAPGPAPEVQAELTRMGHALKVGPDAVHCRVMAVAREGDSLVGASDPRDAGTAAGL